MKNSLENEKRTIVQYLTALREVSDLPEQRCVIHSSLMPSYDPTREGMIDRALSQLVREKTIERTSKGFYRMPVRW